jgi:PadR family transcriptional regulator PadR
MSKEAPLDLLQGTLDMLVLKAVSLEHEGWIAGEWGESENNRRARFYRLTAPGRRRLERETNKWNEFAGVAAVILNNVPEEI